jgi:hypothetical protein
MINVVVAGGESIVGQALELLLGGNGHRVTLVAESHAVEHGLLTGAQLLVLAPGLDEGRRESLLALAAGAVPTNSVPVLELVPYLIAAAADAGRTLVPWPCRAKELERCVSGVIEGLALGAMGGVSGANGYASLAGEAGLREE